MTTMSDDGERTCPLCAEEMDLTDQQLKPCKCGYEICVWCWHHIIDMAEKEDTEGRCPACRTPYDKERIVGTAANCERVVAEMNAEKRQKFQKAKPKPSAEARKHLSSVRVIQRNLVYIIGLPSNLCDENLLERKEYFGQYGKVLKVSISRPTIATGHQTSNSNTFSVYITYTREEEAVRCIQAVHNFVLEGKPLRACFGTTKYCHAWLRNMTCSNPDCLYLHDIGTQEDSFTKDEIISAYTRCRVPQIALNNLQRRSGTVLPSPVDDLCNSGTASCKHAAKSAPNNATSQVKMLSHCSNDGKVTALPAAASWGLRVSNCRQPAASMACSQSVKQKGEAVSSSSMKLNSAWHDDVVATSRISEGRHSLYGDGNSRPVDTMKPSIGRDCRMALESPLDVGHTSETSAWDDDEVMTSKVPEESNPTPVGGNLKPLEPVERNIGRTAVSDMSSEAIMDAALIGEISTNSSSSSLAPATSDIDRGITDARNSTILPEDINHEGFDGQSCDVAPVNIAHGNLNVDGNMEGLCLELSLVNLDNHLEVDRFKVDQHQSTLASHSSVSTLQQGVESSALSVKTSVMTDARVLGESYDCNSELQKQGLQSSGNKMEDRMLASDDQRRRLPDVTSQQVWATFSHEDSCSSASSSSTSWNNNFERMKPLLNEDSRSMTIEDDKHLLLGGQNKSILPNGHLGDKISFSSGSDVVSECSNMNYTKEKANYVGIFDSVSNINKTVNIDTGEHNIISDVLSLDFDPWDDSLSAANNFARLLGKSGKRDGPFKQSGSWKSQTSTESRFSFARQESQANNLEPSIKDIGRVQNISSSPQDSLGDRYQNASFFHNLGGSIAPATNVFISSDRAPGASKVKGSAPPGFSLPNRTPPPGFSSVDRYEQSYRTHSGENHLLGSFPLRNQQQMHVTENTGDVEFIDPAILAVGKGRLSIGVNNSGFGSVSAFPAQFNSFDNDPRFQLLMQQSSSQQDLRLSDHLGDRLLPLNESHVSSRLLTQNSSNFLPFAQLSFQHPRNVQIPSSQWDGWNDVRTGNVIGMVENFRNDRFGLNNYFPGNEEHKFCIPSPGNMYNRAFGM